MRKSPIKLNVKEKEYLEHVVEHAQINKIAKKKLLKIKVILMRNQRKSINEIMKETNLSKRTIINYTNSYLKDNRFFFKNLRNNISALESINAKLLFPPDKPPLSYREAKERILKELDIDRSIIQVRNYLNRNHIYTLRSNHNLNYNARRRLLKYTREYKEKIDSKSI